MQIHRGELQFGKDSHENEEITAITSLESEPAPHGERYYRQCKFHTTAAAIFWLWLIDERIGSRQRRNAR